MNKKYTRAQQSEVVTSFQNQYDYNLLTKSCHFQRSNFHNATEHAMLYSIHKFELQCIPLCVFMYDADRVFLTFGNIMTTSFM